jgi:phytol kinase
MTDVARLLPGWGTPAGELARAALVAVAFLGILAAAEVWKRFAHPPVEWTRKLVHVAGGVVSGTFPWLFSTHWTVLFLGASTLGLLALGKRIGALGSVTGVQRRSVGELLFPGSVYLLFVIARHQPVFYVIALSALVFSDTAAALLGTAYGRHTYTVVSDRKSIEGSVAFLLVTFLAVHLLLLLGTDIERAACVLVAAQLALLVTAFEAISMGGNDNLIVPLMTYYLLVKLTPEPWEGIAIQLLAQLALLAGMILLSFRTGFLTLAGAIAAHLTLYAAFSLGGPGWTVAPVLTLAGILVFYRIAPPSADAAGPRHEVRQVFYVSIVPILLLFLDNSFATLVEPGHTLGSGHPFFIPFVGAFAATLAIVGFRALRRRRSTGTSAAAIAALVAWAAVTPLALWLGPQRLQPTALALTAATCLGGLALYWAGTRWFRTSPAGAWDLRLQAVCVATASAIALPFSIGAAAKMG